MNILTVLEDAGWKIFDCADSDDKALEEMSDRASAVAEVQSPEGRVYRLLLIEVPSID